MPSPHSHHRKLPRTWIPSEPPVESSHGTRTTHGNESEPLVEAFIRDLKAIPKERFEVYQKGWEGHLGMALVDAIYSKQTRYKTTGGGPGIIPDPLSVSAAFIG